MVEFVEMSIFRIFINMLNPRDKKYFHFSFIAHGFKCFFKRKRVLTEFKKLALSRMKTRSVVKLAEIDSAQSSSLDEKQ